MKTAFDTNFLGYGVGLVRAADDMRKQHLSVALYEAIDAKERVIPLNALGELFHVLTRKAGRWKATAADIVLALSRSAELVPTDRVAMESAIGLSVDHGLQIWDAVILVAARTAGCTLLLSEDFQDGFTWSGVTVANPFAANPLPLVRALAPEVFGPAT